MFAFRLASVYALECLSQVVGGRSVPLSSLRLQLV
jgi:hypothetical protein